MNAQLRPSAIKYWSAITSHFVLLGRPLPPRLIPALFRRLRIEVTSDSSGLTYTPHRAEADVEHLTSLYTGHPEFLERILLLTTPIRIRDSAGPAAMMTAPVPAPLFQQHLRPQFLMPAYSETILKIIQSGKPILLVGPNGCGKTRLVQELAKQQQRTVRRVNLDGALTPEAFLGATKVRTKVVKDGMPQTETFFQPGPVTLAMTEGSWLILDEVDKALPEYLCSLHPVAEDVGNPIILLDDGGRAVFPHPNFRVIATSNTLGHADDLSSGYAPGTSPMNQAFLDRFSIFKVSFPANERDIVNTILQDEKLTSKLIEVAKLTRQAAERGEVTHFDFSTRRLISLATTLTILSSLKDTFELELLSRLPDATRSLVESFISNVFGSSWREWRRTTVADSVPAGKP